MVCVLGGGIEESDSSSESHDGIGVNWQRAERW